MAQKKATTPIRKAKAIVSRSTKVSPKKSGKRKSTSRHVKKVKPTKKDTLVARPEPVKLPHKVSLSALNRLLLPISPDQLAIATARYTGIAFVVIGGIFATYHLQSFASSLAYVDTIRLAAQTCDSSIYPECDLVPPTSTDINSGTGSGIDPEQDENPSLDSNAASPDYYNDGEPNNNRTSGTVDATPFVGFLIETEEPLSGEVAVKVLVDNADRVVVYARERFAGMIELGEAIKVSDGEWQITWDTTQFNDGPHKLRVAVENQYGEYTQHDDPYYNILNSQTDGYALNDELQEDNQSDDSNFQSGNQITESPIASALSNVTTSIEPVDDSSNEIALVTRVTLPTSMTALDGLRLFLVGSITGSLREADEVSVIDSGRVYVFRTVFDKTRFGLESYQFKFAVEDNDQVFEYYARDFSSANIDVGETISEGGIKVEDLIRPVIRLEADSGSVVVGSIDILIYSSQAQFVELYARRAGAITERFLGLAKRDGRQGEWIFRWRSTDTPNGSYEVFARIKTNLGIYDSDPVEFKVENQVDSTRDSVPFTPSTVEIVESVTADTETISDLLLEDSIDDSDQTASGVEADSEDIIVMDVVGDDNVFVKEDELPLLREESESRTILKDYRSEIDSEFRRLATALRVGDDANIEDVKSRIDNLKESVAAGTSIEVTDEIRGFFEDLEENTERAERIIKDRVGDEVSKDQDNDGISDYDEVYIYNTDPSSADSDGDGFVDGAEILRGFDPKDPAAEAFVAFESPRDVGVVREDLLVVESVISSEKSPEDVWQDGVEAQAVITGRGLPNSFVTLYIFSTPVIVTVKTDADGSWSYRFDKELEDGSHEVYVGITDNAGKLLAKSEPFSFVKEAQAFTPVDAAEATEAISQTAPRTNNFASQNIVLVVLSISVVGIGVTLVMIGLHLARRREHLVANPLPGTQSESV